MRTDGDFSTKNVCFQGAWVKHERGGKQCERSDLGYMRKRKESMYDSCHSAYEKKIRKNKEHSVAIAGKRY